MSTSVREFTQPMPTPEMRSARQMREDRIKYWRAFIVTAFFVVVIGFNLILGTTVVVGSIKNKLNLSNDTQVFHAAHVMQPMLDGVFCRSTVYDSASARMLDDRVERCSDARGKEKRKKNETGFNWGGK